MDTQALLENLTRIAKLVAPLVPGGGAVVAIAESTLKAIDALGSGDSELAGGRRELEEAVNAHADRTANSLS